MYKPSDIGRKLNIYMMFRRHPRRPFNLRGVQEESKENGIVFYCFANCSI